MRTFEANDELTEILTTNGFIDTTSERDKKKGKKSFKLSKNSRKEIYFDYINIKIWRNSGLQDDRIEMTEEELKLLLLYFKLSTSDIQTIDRNGQFNFKKWAQRIVDIREDKRTHERLNFRMNRVVKMNRILTTLDDIHLN